MSRDKFDLQVHKRNKKGYISSANPYRLLIQDGIQLFERPPGSGIFYGSNNEVVKAPKGFVPAAEIAEENAEKIALEARVKELEGRLAEVAKMEEKLEEASPKAPAPAAPSRPSFLKP